MKLNCKWHAEKANNTICFKNVRFDEAVRGIKLVYKTFSGGTFENTLSVDGVPVSKFMLNGTAYFHEFEDTWAEVPEIKAGTHDIAFRSEDIGNAFIDTVEFTPDSPFDQANVPSVPERTFRETNNDLLVATDMLGRQLPDASEAPAPRDKFVGIFYWTWRNGNGNGGTPRNLTEILSKYPEAEYDMNHPAWTKHDIVHWNKPFYGFYRNDDPYVIRKHAQYFADAGVDVLVFDTTNGSLVWRDAFMPLLIELDKARKDGIHTPQVAFMMNFGIDPNSLRMLRGLYQDLYKPGKFRDLWFMWKGKPMVMAYPECIPQKGISDYDTAVLNEIRDFFTFRPGQPLYAGGPKRDDQWGWLEMAPQNGYVKQADGTYEMCTVGVAQNCNAERICTHFNAKDTFGRSYTHKDGHKKLTKDSYKYGYNVQEQWENALAIDPEYVFVTGWNEWIMGKFPGKPWVREEGSTQIAFVDQYDREHSRDIEPDCDGYLDTYYLQLCANIRRFKGLRHIDRDVPAADIKAGDFDALLAAKPEYVSHKGTQAIRNFEALGVAPRYTNYSGRNNITGARVAWDKDRLSFMAICADNILPDTEHSVNYMTLLIDSDRDKATGWEGYDYKITSGKVYAWKDGSWQEIGQAAWEIRGDKLMLQADRALIGLCGEGKPEFEFKWIDNIALNDVMNFYRDGDCAPFGRFNFIF